ncbi:MAG: autoinducer binding domain-containing protein [Pseudomonadota bacterium]
MDGITNAATATMDNAARFRLNVRLYPDFKPFHPNGESDPVLPYLQRLKNTLGCRHIFYHCLILERTGMVRDGPGLIWFSTCSAHWALQYLYQDHNAVDPLFTDALRCESQTDWRHFRKAHHLKAFWADADRFRLGTEGISIPVHDFANRPALVSFTFDTPEDEWPAFSKARTQDWQIAAHHLHEVALAYHKAYPTTGEVTITPVERRCLTRASAGLDDAEIARHLKMTTQDVANHLDRAAIKLHAENRMHLVAKAVASGLITPPF